MDRDLATFAESSTDDSEQEIELIGVPERRESQENSYDYAEEVEEEENLSLQEKELELIKKALEKHNDKRKEAAEELGISERTLYRKIKQYNL